MYDLNDEQLRAIQVPSPTLVYAAAGSGKTRCLVAKIESLLDSGVPPENILSVTFTNKAADEMKSRLKKRHDITGMQVSTIHSMSVAIIRRFPGNTPLKNPFSIYDEDDQVSVIKTVLKARDMADNARDVLTMISRAKSDDRADSLEGPIQEVYKAYQNILKTNNAADFDDLLIYARDCLKSASVRNHFSEKWPHMLVDEVQDTSKIQFDIILSLYDRTITKTLFMVGDDSQSIYGFRGSRPENIKEFIRDYKPSICNLRYNYRSCSDIIKYANVFQQFNLPMVPKSLTKGAVSLTQFESIEAEAEKIALAILKAGNYEETAILYRVNSRSLEFEKAFARHQIPYKVIGDVPFFRRKVVKDLLAMLKASNNLSDIESLARIINVPKRGFGEAKIEKLLLEGRSYAEKMSKTMPELDSFMTLLDNVRGKKPYDAINLLIQGTGYRNSLQKESDWVMLDALIDVSAGYQDVNELLSASAFMESDSGKGVKLMTAHASKGLEFDRVFVVGVERGLWPHELSLDFEEEGRLFYVACTRARTWLNISCSKQRTYRGKPLLLDPSPLFVRCTKVGGSFGH